MNKELYVNQEIEKGLSPRNSRLLKRAVGVLEKNKYFEISSFFGGRTMISPGVRGFRGVWNWDSAFHAVGVSHFDAKLAIDQIEGFLDYIMEDGMLPDLIEKGGTPQIHSSKPPVFAWAAYEVYKNTGESDFLRRIYNKLVLNEAFWREHRFDGKLFYYGSYLQGTNEEILTWTKWESGWDNSIRWDNGIVEYYPIDLNCFMLMFYESLSEIAKVIGESFDLWDLRKKELSELIENTFWNEELGVYADKNRFKKEFSNVLTPASFMPLYVKTASKERAARMAEIAADKNKFNCTMPTAAYDSIGFSNEYWRGPLWLNTAYFATKGLKNYDLAVAETIKENILNMVDSITDGIYENYDTVGMKGLYYRDFSWSACFVIEFILNA